MTIGVITVAASVLLLSAKKFNYIKNNKNKKKIVMKPVRSTRVRINLFAGVLSIYLFILTHTRSVRDDITTSGMRCDDRTGACARVCSPVVVVEDE